MFNLEEELKKLPGSPGVYLMHNDRDEIIYIGKAISLKNRVRQYFQSSRGKTAKIEQMVSHNVLPQAHMVICDTTEIVRIAVRLHTIANAGVQPDQGAQATLQYHAEG